MLKFHLLDDVVPDFGRSGLGTLDASPIEREIIHIKRNIQKGTSEAQVWDVKNGSGDEYDVLKG